MSAAETPCFASQPISRCQAQRSLRAPLPNGKKSRRIWTGGLSYSCSTATSPEGSIPLHHRCLAQLEVPDATEARHAFRHSGAELAGQSFSDILARREVDDVLGLDHLARHVIHAPQGV